MQTYIQNQSYNYNINILYHWAISNSLSFRSLSHQSISLFLACRPSIFLGFYATVNMYAARSTTVHNYTTCQYVKALNFLLWVVGVKLQHRRMATLIIDNLIAPSAKQLLQCTLLLDYETGFFAMTIWQPEKMAWANGTVQSPWFWFSKLGFYTGHSCHCHHGYQRAFTQFKQKSQDFNIQ